MTARPLRRLRSVLGRAPAAASRAMSTNSISSFFVYGTLRPDDISGQSWTKEFLKSASSCRRSRLADHTLYISPNRYPHAVPRKGGAIRGTLVEFPESLMPEKLSFADEVEGVNFEDQTSEHGYKRVKVEVVTDDEAYENVSSAKGEPVQTWVYIKDSCDPGAEEIPEGDFVAHYTRMRPHMMTFE